MIPGLAGTIARALAQGYGYDKILNFIKSGEPKVAEAITRALSSGYKADAILKFMSAGTEKKPKAFQSSANLSMMPGTDAQKRMYARDNPTINPNARRVVGLAKAGASALAGYGLAKLAGGLVGGLGQQETQEPQIPEQMMEAMKSPDFAQGAQSQPDMMEQVGVMAEGGMTPAEAFEHLEKRGVADVFTALSKRVEDPNKAFSSMKRAVGDKMLAEMAQEAGIAPQDLIGLAFKHAEGIPAPAGRPKAPQDPEAFAEKESKKTAETLADVYAKEAVEEPIFYSNADKEPIMADYLKDIGRLTLPAGKPISAKQIRSMNSSNVEYIDYDPESKKMQVLFAPSESDDPRKGKGAIYEYSDIPQELIDKIRGGEGKAKTSGTGVFRAWFSDDDKSIGAAFNEAIKVRDENGDYKYKPSQISESDVRDEDLLKLRGASQVMRATKAVDAFENLFLKAQAKDRAKAMKIADQAVRKFTDQELEDAIFEATRSIQSEKKAAKAKGKQTRFKGGVEEEIKRRVERRIS